MSYYNTFKMTDGDIDIVGNDLAMVSGQEEMRQNVENRLAVNKKERFLNIEMGLSYKEIVGKGVTDDDISFWVRECILQDSRIKEVRNISINREVGKREAYIDVTVIDPYGKEVTLPGVINFG